MRGMASLCASFNTKSANKPAKRASMGSYSPNRQTQPEDKRAVAVFSSGKGSSNCLKLTSTAYKSGVVLNGGQYRSLQSMFKPYQQLSDFKKRRDGQSDRQRRSIREEIFIKRRNILLQELSPPTYLRRDRLHIVDDRFRPQIETFLSCHYTIDLFPQLIAFLNDENIVQQHQGMIGIRKILSVQQDPPIQEIIDAGLVPKMIEFVKQSEYPQLQLEATWALTNVAAGTSAQCQTIIDKGGIPLFVELLQSDKAGILQQAIWAIGNIASDCVFYRDMILKTGALANIIAIIEGRHDAALVMHGCWALSNLCRGSPLPRYELVKAAIPVLCRVIASCRMGDKQILAGCCWAVFYHSDASKNKTKALPQFIQHLSDPNLSLLIPSLRILGNISNGQTDQTNHLLAHDILTPLEKVLVHSLKGVRREVCWLISNIAAGNRAQCEAIIARDSLVNKVLQMFEADSNEVRRQICFIFSNLTHSGTPPLIFKLYKQTRIVRYYINCLTSQDTRLVEVALSGLFLILQHGDKFKSKGVNLLLLDVKNYGAVELLEKLQYHQSDTVYELVSKILQSFFDIQDPLSF